MRNLQKILALVLALVMSLSLMATAGATDFSDDAEIDETFRESVDVLNGLKVFQGYDNGAYFSPKGDITRAEVAAIIYRIATGDVTDSQVKIYADYNKFSDVPSDHWAAGYINYCTNAEYIKGRGDGKFYPSDKVTGYEALAMILRVVGYDKNGEFTGADWQVQTAATANQRKVTKNVNAGTLGTPATRETVAELLCQAILIEKVNYTLAFGYQISTDPKDTIAYETFQMERLTGVVTGNEIADLKETSPMAAGQTRMVIDGEERVLNVVSGLEDIGKSVRMYVRPQSGTTRYDMVTDDVYATELNKVYDSFASVSSVGNSTASSEGITSIAGAEHYINYDYVTRWTARMRITYVMDLEWTQYQAYAMRRDNGGSLYKYQANATTPPFGGEIGVVSGTDSSDTTIGTDRSQWNTRFEQNGPTYTYVKTISLDDELTQQDWDNLKAIFTDADKVSNWLNGEVYVGTASYTATDDISDEIRWEDFIATYLKNEETRQQVESNGLGNRLIIIDNDNDGIAEYVLQTIYTIGKVVPNGSSKTLSAVESKFNHTSDKVNIVSQDDDLVSVSGKELAASENVLNVDDVVIYAKIDGNLRAQLAETATGRVTAINRASSTATLDNEIGEKKQSAVHPHADGLASGVANMVIGTNYTVYYDLDGNLAAFVEGNVGSFVLITDGWYNQAVNAREYAVQAYIDGRLQTVNVTNNGSLFVENAVQNNNNSWGRLSHRFGSSLINSANTNGNKVQTIVANIEDGNLVPVDKSYRVSQNVAMLDMVNNAIPTRDGSARGNVYNTVYSLDNIAYTERVNDTNGNAVNFEVLGRSDTVYYYVHSIGKTVNGQNNYVVRTYTGYANIPAVDPSYIEDVYTVGIRAGRTTANNPDATYYTAEVVVVELNEKYLDSRVTSEQVFIPSTGFVSGNIQGVGLEQVEMIRGNGAVETVWVDMRQSDFRGYDEAWTSGATTNNYSGLYFMDPIGTTTDGEVTYKIEYMNRSRIRANNYLAGYVSQTNVTNDHVRVDMQVPGAINGFTSPVDATVNDHNIVHRQGATITANSKLYKLGYNGSGVPTLNGDLTAAEVFYRNPDPNVSSTDTVVTNELWDRNTGLFNLQPRNEVLVRYDDNGNVIWAISFREFRTGSTRDVYAQDAWWKCLPSAADNTNPTSFWGDNTIDSGAGTAANPYRITMSHEDALKAQNDHNIIDVTATVGTVVTYKLEKWNGTNWVEIPRDQINAEKVTTTDEQRYQLTVTLNQGEPIVYILVKAKALDGAKLEENSYVDLNTKVITVPTAPSEDISKFLSTFKVTNNGSIDWTVVVDGTPYNFNSKDTIPPALVGRRTDSISSIAAVIRNETGAATGDMYFNSSANAVEAGKEIAENGMKQAIEAAGANFDAVKDQTAVRAIIDEINTAIEACATPAAVQQYLTSAQYQNALARLAAAATSSNVVKMTFTAGTDIINAAVGTSNIGTVGTQVGTDPTITLTRAVDKDGEYLFTATKVGSDPLETKTATLAAGANTITFTGLTIGTWNLTCVKVETAAQTVKFTNSDPACTIRVNNEVIDAVAGVNVVPGKTLTFTVEAPVGYTVVSVGSAQKNDDGSWTYTMPVSQNEAVILAIETRQTENVVSPETGIVSGTVNKVSGIVTLTEVPTITEDTTIELAPNSTLNIAPETAGNYGIVVDNKDATLTITGAGKIASNVNRAGAIFAVKNGTLDVTGATISHTDLGAGDSLYTYAVAGVGGQTGGTINLTSVKIENIGNGLATNNTDTASYVFNLTDCIIDAKNAGAYVTNENATFNITGGQIIGGDNSGFEISGGTLNLYGVALESKVGFEFYTGNQGAMQGAALAITPYAKAKVTVNADGGTTFAHAEDGHKVAVLLRNQDGVGTYTTGLREITLSSIQSVEDVKIFQSADQQNGKVPVLDTYGKLSVKIANGLEAAPTTSVNP